LSRNVTSPGSEFGSTSTGLNAGGGVGNMSGISSGFSSISSNSSTSINDSLFSAGFAETAQIFFIIL
jgi:hypothetical protein